MAKQIDLFLEAAVGYVWNLPLVFLLLGAGLIFTLVTHGVQFRGFIHSLVAISGRYDEKKDTGEITHFQALSAALSATVGLGNISGVAVAIKTGGPGALFWMWIAAILGMATKFATCSLAVMHRKIDSIGSISGGPMYYIELGLGKSWKPLAMAFAFFAAIGTLGGGNMFQANQCADVLREYFGVPAWITGVVLVFLVGLVIIGGIQRIGKVTSKLMPLMCGLYVLGALVVLSTHIKVLPGLFVSIFHDAFTGTAAIGGFAGIGMRQVLIQGVRRAVFSNEAGLGSAPMAHAAAKTKEPIREGVVAMIGPFIDTILVCSMTAMVILATGVWQTSDKSGVALTVEAFNQGLAGFSLGLIIVPLSVFFFALSTMISWSYYGQKAMEYMFGPWIQMPYRIFFICLIFVGAMWKLGPVLNFSDITLGLMAIPNLIGTLWLIPTVRRETSSYFARLKAGKF